jgi:predicted nucleic acid-binding protein
VIVVADTTPLNYLILIGQTQVLTKLFSRVLVPEAVITELRHLSAPVPVRDWSGAVPEWVETRRPNAFDSALGYLGAGERETIMLAQETGADLVLIDERAGRREAARRGLSVAGTLAVLDEAAQRGLLDFDFAITRLRQTNFRLSPAILKAFTWR